MLKMSFMMSVLFFMHFQVVTVKISGAITDHLIKTSVEARINDLKIYICYRIESWGQHLLNRSVWRV